MKYLATIAASAVIIATSTAPASALNINTASSPFKLQITQLNSPALIVQNTKESPKSKAEDKPQPAPAPVVYEVISGDNLSKIGSAHGVEWQRLYAKNLQIEHPDMIKIGEKITIPAAEEQLSREIPAAVSLPAVTPGVEPYIAPAPARSAPEAPRAAASVRSAASYDAGNTYDYGYCTWYVKNKRGASLPNGLGNANTWQSRAAAFGMATGSTPQAGAVGTTTRGQFGHVVYVESVNADGSINISEMNREGFGVTSYRTASASEFVYIY